jgi:hypothetical protein
MCIGSSIPCGVSEVSGNMNASWSGSACNLAEYHSPSPHGTNRNVLFLDSSNNTIATAVPSIMLPAKIFDTSRCVITLSSVHYRNTSIVYHPLTNSSPPTMCSSQILNICLEQCAKSTRLPRKFCNTSYASVKINRECLQFFLWLILNVPLATAGLWNNTFSRACPGGRQNGVIWWYAF